MGDMGDFWRDVKPGMEQRSREKKTQNKYSSTRILKENKIKFISKNDGIHLIVEDRFDFWPTTGKFIERETNFRGRGVFNLLRALKK